ncbi:T9SS type A sorting domain-containing protein [Flavobacterium sp.]|uniref:T9SS type A sorting domain-containing protein n=1 Tax=Flavobacterium sp. TaxID=239 RepID=UPI003C503F1F
MKEKSQKIKWITSVFLCLMSFNTFSKNIHVAKDGVNATTSSGTSIAPYQTIGYLFANSLVSAGDVIIVHAGVYRETVVVNVNNITIKANVGEDVTITGANWYGESSWSDPDGDGVFELSLSTSQVETAFTQLFVNGQDKQIARFPNNISPYKNYISGSNREMLDPRNQQSGFAVLLNGSKPAGTNQTGNITFSWFGGTPKIPSVTFTNEAIVRGFIGKLRNNIFSYSGDLGEVSRAGDRLVTFKSVNTQGNIWGGTDAVVQPEGFGYIMDYSVLDYEGEWFWRKNQNKIYYKPEEGTVIGKNFDIQRRQFTLKVQANNLKVENIDFKVGEVELTNANTTMFTNCTFTYMTPFQYRRTYGLFEQGIKLTNADNTTFESCYIGHTWGSGIIISAGSDNTKINNCYIEDIGWMGQFTVAVLNNGNNTQITKNTFGKASRFHIRCTESVFMNVTDNDFFGAMSMGEDAGSIMFTSTGKTTALDMNETVIAWNKIHDQKGIPAFEPTLSSRKYTVALYLEDVENYTVHHNLIYNIDDEYTSVRLKSDGTPETLQNINLVGYFGPRDRNITKKMDIFNNSCWGYNKLISFWHNDSTADINDMNLKNNLFMTGKECSVGTISDTDLNNFTLRAASTYGYDISLEKNKFITNATDHYIDAENGNLRLKPSSLFNTGGAVIPGITSEISPAIGAWEGSSTALKERVFNAGSNLTNTSFLGKSIPNKFGLKLVDKLSEEIIIYPSPFVNSLKVLLPEVISGQKVVLKITDLNGRIVMNEYLYSQENKEITLDTGNLNPGVYILEINFNGSKIIKKIVK